MRFPFICKLLNLRRLHLAFFVGLYQPMYGYQARCSSFHTLPLLQVLYASSILHQKMVCVWGWGGEGFIEYIWGLDACMSSFYNRPHPHAASEFMCHRSQHSTDGPNDAGMWKYIGLELYRLVNLNCDVLGEIMYWIVGALAQ